MMDLYCKIDLSPVDEELFDQAEEISTEEDEE